jgi:predicted nucleic acid-binding protein
LIFLDTNVISETLRKTPNPAVIAWLVRNDAELALPTVTIAEIAFGIGKIRPDQRAARLEQGLAACAIVLPTGSSPSRKPPRSPMATL